MLTFFVSFLIAELLKNFLFGGDFLLFPQTTLTNSTTEIHFLSIYTYTLPIEH